MKTWLSDKFFKRFDFINTSGDPHLDAMVWGLDVGPGWFRLLWRLCEGLEKTEKDNKYFQVEQVKEKFGTLRFYTTGATKKGEALITQAEKDSAKTCEVCGKPGILRNRHGWLYVSCEEHERKGEPEDD